MIPSGAAGHDRRQIVVGHAAVELIDPDIEPRPVLPGAARNSAAILRAIGLALGRDRIFQIDDQHIGAGDRPFSSFFSESPGQTAASASGRSPLHHRLRTVFATSVPC
jgi:hypothetical protein